MGRQQWGVIMRAKADGSKDVDAYIAGFPKDVQVILEKVRQTIRRAAPKAEERISYQNPCFTLSGRNLIFFSAFKRHIGLYPAPREEAEFKQELSAYKGGKGTVQFPLDKKIPYELIRRIVTFKVKENLARTKARAAKG
jgi:uncharacterized protein YdhG (YjbR/CyaY superfamily)